MSESRFRAPLLTNELAEPDAAEVPFENQLLGFCVAATIEQTGRPRAWWAAHLRLSKSHISKMTTNPNGQFLGAFDLAVGRVRKFEQDKAGGAGEDPRLRARLSDFWSEICPVEGAMTVLDYLARYPGTAPMVQQALLDSEVALRRIELIGQTDAENDPLVSGSIEKLLDLASGPYGGATIAHHRAAELGIQVPRAFFRALDRHLSQSPVGFRTLRTMDRFVKLWRALDETDLSRQEEIEQRLSRLLFRLAAASHDVAYLDPYPGAEWGITLSRDCLHERHDPRRALRWLGSVYANPDANDRARLYAAWAALSYCPPDQADGVLQALSKGSAPFLARWVDLLGRLGELQQMDQVARDAAVTDCFRETRDEVTRSVGAVLEELSGRKGPAYLASVREAFESVLFSVLVTPDARTRRALIEGVVAADLVEPAQMVLTRLHASDLDPSQQEIVVFFLNRLRQPGSLALVSGTAAASTDPHVVHTALWGIGDLWQTGAGGPLTEVAEQLAAAASDSSLSRSDSGRIAAAHALAVIAFHERKPAAKGSGVSAGSTESTGPTQPTEATEATETTEATEAIEPTEPPDPAGPTDIGATVEAGPVAAWLERVVERSGGEARVDDFVRSLCTWGLKMQTGSGIVAGTTFGRHGPLQRQVVAEQDDF